MQSEETKKTELAPKRRSKYRLFVGVLLVVFGAALLAFVLLRETQPRRQIVTINNQRILVEVARTPEARSKGLCCRDSLPENHGMLFVYNKPGYYTFWMKDTHIPLDIYWIDSTKKIVHVEHSVQPSSYPNNFGPPRPAQYVLETNAGFAKRHRVKVGDFASFRQ